MNDILKALRAIEAVESKTTLTESAVAECGEMGMPAPAAENPGNPVTASVTLNASGMDHVADLMRLLQQAGLEKAGPVAAEPMPMRTDMENLRDKMAGLEGLPSEPKPQYFDVDDVTGGGDDIHSKKEPEDIRIKDSSLADDVRDSEIEEWENEPEEDYQDHNYMLKDLAGGINREKRQYRAAQPGDNAMAVESIKDRLYRALSEKKAKPDFLDLDGDGDTEEPMKKAAKDAKKKKGPVKEASTIGGYPKKYVDQGLKLYRKEKDDGALSSEAEGIVAYIAQQKFGFSNDEAERFAEYISNRDSDLAYASGPKSDLDRENMHGALKRALASEAEFQAPTHELDQTARQAMSVAQKIKRKINSGEQMDDRDYNQMAELGAILSRFGTNFGPKSMKDVMNHMKQYTDDRNQEGHGYPEFDVNRFKELISMAKSTGESAVSEISPDLAKRYTKNAKIDRDNTDHILKRDGSTNDWKTNQELQKRNSKRTKGINRAAKRM